MLVWVVRIIVLISALTTEVSALAEPSVVIRPITQLMQSRSIFLSDVAEFVDVPADLANSLSRIKLADAPKPGERLEFTGSALSSIFRAHRAWTAENRPNFRIPSQVVIENVSDKVNESQVRLEIGEKWQNQCQCRVEISELVMPILEPWQAGTQWRLQIPNEAAKGSFTLALELTSAKGSKKTLWVRGKAGLFRQVAVATRQIYFGERVQKGDFTMMERDVTFARDASASENEIVGRRAKQVIAAQDILFKGMLEREKALSRGDAVKVAMSENEWEVSVTGIAEQDGFVGDTVKVRNPKTQQLIVATVVGRGEARAQ